MRKLLAWHTVGRLLLASVATLAFAQPAAALDADYWRGGWRTPLGESPHIYQFVIRGSRLTGVYCRNCSDATTIGFIDGTWDEKSGMTFKVTFPEPEWQRQVRGRPARRTRRGTAHRDGDVGRAERPGGDAHQGSARRRSWRRTGLSPAAGHAPGAAGTARRWCGRWWWRRWWRPAAPVRRPTGRRDRSRRSAPRMSSARWIASFGLGMNRQIFTFLRVGDRLRGVVCGRCDNPYTIGPMENILIVGDKLYFDIVHQDWGEINPPTFDRSIVAQLVQNELLAGILGNGVVIDPKNPPARPAGRGGFTILGPISIESDERPHLRGHRRLGAWHRERGSTAARPHAARARQPEPVGVGAADADMARL